MSTLEGALRRSRDLIEAALIEARAELTALNARRAELENLIAQGESALRGAQARAGTDAGLTLHDALQRILRENGNRPVPVRQLADEVNKRGLYRTREGDPVEVGQVHARASNYDKVFGKAGSLVWLKEEPGAVTPFKDDDAGFRAWISDNTDGYVINTDRNPKPSYLVLHRSNCSHLRSPSNLNWTKDYVKFCSPDAGDLETWAASAVGGEVTKCTSCLR